MDKKAIDKIKKSITAIKPTDVTNYRKHHAEDCHEVTSSRLFISSSGGLNIPDPNGLLSTVIFGETPEEKRRKNGYINLKGHYIRPNVYKVMKRSFRGIDSVIAGTKKYSIDSSGYLVEDEEGKTGLAWLYTEWDNIKFKKFKITGDERVTLKDAKKLLSSKDKTVIFTKYQIVYPLAYRDINHVDGGHIAVDEINETYQKILSMVSMLDDNKENPMYNRNEIKFRIQTLVISLYDIVSNLLFYKDGIQRRNLMSKRPDFGSYNIITAVNFSGDKFGKSPVNIDTYGYPLTSASAVYSLFVVRMMIIQLTNFYNAGMIVDKKGKIISQEDFEDWANPKEMKDIIKLYGKSWGERFNKLEIKDVSAPIKIDAERFEGGKWVSYKKEITIAEFLYMCTYHSVEEAGMHMICTRFPINDPFNVMPAKIHVLSTQKTMKVKVNGYIYEYFPDTRSIEQNEALVSNPVEFEKEVSSCFNETIKISNMQLEGYNGDYDGDKLICKPIMTVEGNAECAAALNSFNYLFDLRGNDIKRLGREATQCLYSFTIPSKKDSIKVDKILVNKILNTHYSEIGLDFIFKTCGLGAFGNKQAKYKKNDIVVLEAGSYTGVKKEIKTTLGRLLFNKIVLSIVDFPYVDETLNKKEQSKVFTKIANDVMDDLIEVKTFKIYKNVYEDFAMRMGSFINPSTPIDMIDISDNITNLKKDLLEKHKDEIEAGNIDVVSDIQEKLAKASEEEYKDSESIELYQSGSKASIRGEFMTSKLMIGALPQNVGTGSYANVTASLIEGYEKKDYMKIANSSILGAFFRGGSAVAKAGYEKKKIISTFQSLFAGAKDSDCKTEGTLEVLVTERMANELIGKRYIQEKGKPVLVTYDNIERLIGKKVKMRSPIKCKMVGGICNKCLGDKYYKLYKDLPKGDRIPLGLRLDKVYSEVSQKNMKKSHDISIKSYKIDKIEDFLGNLEEVKK